MKKLKVNITGKSGRLPLERADIRKLARLAAPSEWNGGEVNIIFVDDHTISGLNRQYFGKDNPTDVISFPLENGLPVEGDTTMGEVVISVETAIKEAELRERNPGDELALYIVHGVLHLAGYTDTDDDGRSVMYKKEAQILAKAGYPCGR